MTEQPKRKSSLARSSQGGRSLDEFVARANEQLAEVATAFTLENRESREDALQREIEGLKEQLARETEALKTQLARRRRRASIAAVAAFALGAAAMFAIELARSSSREAPVSPSTSQAVVEPPPAAPPVPAAPTTPPPVVTPPPATVVTPPPPPAPPPVAARPPKQKPPAKPATPATPPPDDPGLFNPF